MRRPLVRGGPFEGARWTSLHSSHAPPSEFMGDSEEVEDDFDFRRDFPRALASSLILLFGVILLVLVLIKFMDMLFGDSFREVLSIVGEIPRLLGAA